MTTSNNPDERYMARALALAARGRYTCHPNPRVGCVIVKAGAVVGEGWHEQAGEAHAEVRALAQAGPAAWGATVYVTLEPCCHQGRTPPCTDALIQAGVARVVAAMADPNPAIAGQGLEILQAAGIRVETGVQETAASELNAGFIARMTRGRPRVILKMAMSLDGRTALASGESRWITSEAARGDVHRQRAEAGTVLVGADTVLADDPQLNVRLPGRWRQPDRVVLDTHAHMPSEARMLGQPGRTLVLTARPESDNARALNAGGAEVIGVAQHDGHLDLKAALTALAEQGINAVLVEAGPQLAGAVMEAGLVDELLLYMAPNLLGDTARGLMHLPVLERLDQRLELRFVDVRRVGPNLRITLQPENTP